MQHHAQVLPSFQQPTFRKFTIKYEDLSAAWSEIHLKHVDVVMLFRFE